MCWHRGVRRPWIIRCRFRRVSSSSPTLRTTSVARKITRSACGFLQNRMRGRQPTSGHAMSACNAFEWSSKPERQRCVVSLRTRLAKRPSRGSAHGPPVTSCPFAVAGVLVDQDGPRRPACLLTGGPEVGFRSEVGSNATGQILMTDTVRI